MKKGIERSGEKGKKRMGFPLRVPCGEKKKKLVVLFLLRINKGARRKGTGKEDGESSVLGPRGERKKKEAPLFEPQPETECKEKKKRWGEKKSPASCPFAVGGKEKSRNGRSLPFDREEEPQRKERKGKRGLVGAVERKEKKEPPARKGPKGVSASFQHRRGEKKKKKVVDNQVKRRRGERGAFVAYENWPLVGGEGKRRFSHHRGHLLRKKKVGVVPH